MRPISKRHRAKKAPPRRKTRADKPRARAKNDEAAARPAARQPKRRKTTTPVHHEAIAVGLWCLGVMSLLALLSYHPADVSLNASGDPEVHNWIGPAGAYWADLLLQLLGIGAFAFALGLLLAGWRAFAGRRILPRMREAAGGSSLIICVGSFAHLAMEGRTDTFPAGGVAGAILGDLLLENFATTGGYILSGTSILLSLAVAADGVLSGLGLKGLGAVREGLVRLQASLVYLLEKRRRLAERRAERRAELRALQHEAEPVEDWTLGEVEPGGHDESIEDEAPVPDRRRRRKAERLAAARDKARARADAEAAREEEEARRQALREHSEPKIRLDNTIDIPAEESFELGELPAFAPAEAASDGHAELAEVVELEEDEVQIDVPICAAEPGVSPASAPALREVEVAPAPQPREVKPASPPPPVEPADSVAASAAEAAPPAMAAAAPVVTDEAPKRVTPKSRKKKGPGEPQIVDVRPAVDIDAIERAAEEEPAREDTERDTKPFELPRATLLDIQVARRAPIDSEILRENAQKLTKTLKSYGIDGHVREIRPGPVITMYEYVPAPGIKISKIANLADDLAMSMEALRVRIVAPIPGKGAVGIEIPNDSTETVYLKELITHERYRNTSSKLTVALGKDIEGSAFMANLQKMPHLLVAGATGAGKSVSVNSMIMSILFKAKPEEVRMIMVDPKMLELSIYDGIPHLLLPVVTDPKKASLALRWAVEEMERRYKKLSALGVRNIDSYNRKVREAQEAGQRLSVNVKDKLGNEEEERCEHLPYIVVIVDELADLMMVASREVEASIMRLAQMARAAGIHLILATQRPSVDVITGVIKANFPTRIAFQVASKHDSRTILDANGAEHLLGRGDMLYLSSGVGGLKRVHGAFVSDDEIQRTVAFLKEQGEPQYDPSILAPRDDGTAAEAADEDRDEMYDQALAIVAETRQASISMIQRRLRIGYNRAARLVETMEAEGLVGPADGSKPREVLIPPETM